MTLRMSLPRLPTAAIFVVAAFWVWSCGAQTPDKGVATDAAEFVGNWVDWRPQDFHTTQGVTAVHYDNKSKRLITRCDLDGRDKDRTGAGETLVDLKYVVGYEALVPMDLSSSTMTVDVQIPPLFVGPRSKPNGCRAFVKDDQGRSQYGTWTNCVQPGLLTVTLEPSTTAPPDGWMDGGFDPTRIQTIGVGFAINGESSFQFSGTIPVRSVRIAPPPPVFPLPELPPDDPQPFIRGYSKVTLRLDGFYFGKSPRKAFVVGGNWRMIEYGQNFGTTAWYPWGNGVSKHREYLRDRLDLYRRAGVTLVRVGLLDDGRTMLKPNDRAVLHSPRFDADVSALLNMAKQVGVKVEFVLVDYLIAGKREVVDDVQLRGHRRIIEDPAARAAFLHDFLVPFLIDFGDHPALFGIDVINEPEWLISQSEGGRWELVTDERTKAETPVARKAIEDFVAACAARVRWLAPGKFVTVGVSCPNVDLTRNLPLRYTAIHHYYDWMNPPADYLPTLPANRAWSLEEFPGTVRGPVYPGLAWYLNFVHDNGGAAALVWNLSPAIDARTHGFDEEEDALWDIRDFVMGLPQNADASAYEDWPDAEDD